MMSGRAGLRIRTIPYTAAHSNSPATAYSAPMRDNSFFTNLKIFTIMPNSTGKIPYSVSMRESSFARVQVPKAYATLQVRNKVTIDDLAKHIAEHNSKYSRADITAISIELVHCIKEFLLQGNKVQFGEIGEFYNKIRQNGASSTSDFSAANITKLTAGFKPGKDLKDFRSEASFEVVPGRKNQALLLAAEKGGADMMSLYRVEGNGGGGGGDDEDDEDENPEIIGQ